VSYTKGPWHTKTSPEWPGAKWRVDDKPDVPWGNFGEIAMVNCKSNALLIAAAPDLYEACKLAEETLRIGLYADTITNTLTVIRSALAKATPEARP
jgi:hypothetical protein